MPRTYCFSNCIFSLACHVMLASLVSNVQHTKIKKLSKSLSRATQTLTTELFNLMPSNLQTCSTSTTNLSAKSKIPAVVCLCRAPPHLLHNQSGAVSLCRPPQ